MYYTLKRGGAFFTNWEICQFFSELLWVCVSNLVFQLELAEFLETWHGKLLQLPVQSIALSLLPFALYLLVFSNYTLLRSLTGLDLVSQPNVHTLPMLERSLFLGCLPHRFFSAYAHPLFDVLAAIPYLVHFPLPALYGLWLVTSRQRRRDFFQFMWLAGWVNFIAVLIQLTVPTAPPWFADSAVFDQGGQLISASPNEAGFERLDALVGVSIFHDIYSKSPVKFGAFPSLHVAWPTIIVACRPWLGFRLAVLHVVWITWAALYSTHHYGIDALGGILLVVVLRGCVKMWHPFKERHPRVVCLRPYII